MHSAKNFPLKKMKSTLDVELPDYVDDEFYLAKLQQHMPIVFGAAKPDIVFYLAGVDIVKVSSELHMQCNTFQRVIDLEGSLCPNKDYRDEKPTCWTSLHLQ